MHNFEHTTLIMLVAPSGVGKSTILQEVVSRDPRFSRVRGFTTRPPRKDDATDQFFYLTDDELRAQRAAGEIFTEAFVPSTGYTYGSTIDSYATERCVLETLSSSVDDYRAVSFATTQTISITTKVELWLAHFMARYPTPSSEAIGRLKEGQQSIEWSLAQSDMRWIVNDTTPTTAAQRLIDVVGQQNQGDKDGPVYAHACLAEIKKLTARYQHG